MRVRTKEKKADEGAEKSNAEERERERERGEAEVVVDLGRKDRAAGV
jgi:hypothetical protein